VVSGWSLGAARALLSPLGCRAKSLLRDLPLEDGGARGRKLGWVERRGNVAVVDVVAGVIGLVVVGMLVGSGFVVVGTFVRRRVHVDVGSEVAGEPFLQGSRMMAGQSERESVDGVLS
jgi:hypothetical protein